MEKEGWSILYFPSILLFASTDTKKRVRKGLDLLPSSIMWVTHPLLPLIRKAPRGLLWSFPSLPMSLPRSLQQAIMFVHLLLDLFCDQPLNFLKYIQYSFSDSHLRASDQDRKCQLRRKKKGDDLLRGTWSLFCSVNPLHFDCSARGVQPGFKTCLLYTSPSPRD